jgi:hypothetical protein
MEMKPSRFTEEEIIGILREHDVAASKAGPNNGSKRRATYLARTNLQPIFMTCVAFEQHSCVAEPGRMILTNDSGEYL